MMHDPQDAPHWIEGIDNPYLHGMYAPVAHESEADDLAVEGELPRDLYGAYVRNGPNPIFAPPNLYHWFDGDGMVHGVWFEDGKARYRSRWVRTDDLAQERAAGHALWPGIMGPIRAPHAGHFLKDTANTDLLFHNGRLLATWYLAGAAYALDPRTLEPLAPGGKEDFGGGLHTTISAHPKVDARTGELLWFTYGDAPPYMTYGVVSADGKALHQIPVDLPGPRSPHDLTFTERFTILHDFPYFHDVDLLRETGRRVARFHRDVPSRFGVVPRLGGSDEVRWFEFEPGYVLHMVNAWEEGDWIVMDGCRQPDPTIRRRPEEGKLASMLGYFRQRFHLHRWRMNTATGETAEEPLDDLNVEFPLPDTQRYGRKTRFSYHQRIPADGYTLQFEALVKYDHESGGRSVYEYGPERFGSEAPYAPRSTDPAADEDDGWVVTIVNDAATLSSECQVFAAQEIERGPIARVKLPARVPAGFHAKWIPGAQLDSD